MSVCKMLSLEINGMTSHDLFWTRFETKMWQITVILKDS